MNVVKARFIGFTVIFFVLLVGMAHGIPKEKFKEKNAIIEFGKNKVFWENSDYKIRSNYVTRQNSESPLSFINKKNKVREVNIAVISTDGFRGSLYYGELFTQPSQRVVRDDKVYYEYHGIQLPKKSEINFSWKTEGYDNLALTGLQEYWVYVWEGDFGNVSSELLLDPFTNITSCTNTATQVVCADGNFTGNLIHTNLDINITNATIYGRGNDGDDTNIHGVNGSVNLSTNGNVWLTDSWLDCSGGNGAQPAAGSGVGGASLCGIVANGTLTWNNSRFTADAGNGGGGGSHCNVGGNSLVTIDVQRFETDGTGNISVTGGVGGSNGDSGNGCDGGNALLNLFADNYTNIEFGFLDVKGGSGGDGDNPGSCCPGGDGGDVDVNISVSGDYLRFVNTSLTFVEGQKGGGGSLNDAVAGTHDVDFSSATRIDFLNATEFNDVSSPDIDITYLNRNNGNNAIRLFDVLTPDTYLVSCYPGARLVIGQTGGDVFTTSGCSYLINVTEGNYPITLNNSRPNLTDVDILEISPGPNINLTCNYTVYNGNGTLTDGLTDVDGDTLTASYLWYRNSVLQGGNTSSNFDQAYTSDDDVMLCAVNVTDGVEYWPTDGYVNSTSVTIGDNAPPAIYALSIANNAISTDDSQTFTVSCNDTQSDIDNIYINVTRPGATTVTRYDFSFVSSRDVTAQFTLTDITAGTFYWNDTYCEDGAGNFTQNHTVFSFLATAPSASGGGGGGGEIINATDEAILAITCGNTVCDRNENFANCFQDCPVNIETIACFDLSDQNCLATQFLFTNLILGFLLLVGVAFLVLSGDNR